MRNHNIYHHIKGSQKKEKAQLNGFPPGINRVNDEEKNDEGDENFDDYEDDDEYLPVLLLHPDGHLHS